MALSNYCHIYKITPDIITKATLMNTKPVNKFITGVARLSLICILGLVSTIAIKLNHIIERLNNSIAATLLVKNDTCGVMSVENRVIKNTSALGFKRLV